MTKARLARLVTHCALLIYCVVAIGPISLIVMNSFKTKKGIFGAPLELPNSDTFSLVGYHSVLAKGDFEIYFMNSLIVTFVSLALVLLLATMAAWALTEYKFRGNVLLSLFLAIGIMVPIRLGSVSILKIMSVLSLVNTLPALIIVYVAMGLPLAIFILGEFVQQIPGELKDAARCDGVNEYRIFWHIIIPLVRPALATVAIFTMVPIWNDLWFPLILAPGKSTQTVTLGVQQFIGQYVTDWNAVLASLSLAIAPILVLYLMFSHSLVRGLTAGAVK